MHFFSNKPAPETFAFQVGVEKSVYVANDHVLILGGNGRGKTADIGRPNAIEALEKGNSLVVTCVTDEYEQDLADILHREAVETVYVNFPDNPKLPDLSDLSKRQVAVFIRIPHFGSNDERKAVSRMVTTLLANADGGKGSHPTTFILDDFHELGYVSQLESYLVVSGKLTNHIMMLSIPHDSLREYDWKSSFRIVGVVNGRNIDGSVGESLLKDWLGDELDLTMLHENGDGQVLVFVKDYAKQSPATIIKTELFKKEEPLPEPKPAESSTEEKQE